MLTSRSCHGIGYWKIFSFIWLLSDWAMRATAISMMSYNIWILTGFLMPVFEHFTGPPWGMMSLCCWPLIMAYRLSRPPEILSIHRYPTALSHIYLLLLSSVPADYNTTIPSYWLVWLASLLVRPPWGELSSLAFFPLKQVNAREDKCTFIAANIVKTISILVDMDSVAFFARISSISHDGYNIMHFDGRRTASSCVAR